MRVTYFSKKLAAMEPEWAQWDSEFPDQTVNFRERGRFYGDPIASGKLFHRAFCLFTEGTWVPPVHHAACLAIEAVLADQGIFEIQSEVPVQGFGLTGQVDIKGTLNSGRPVVVELKTTLGEYALKPKPAEVIQLGTYAAMLRHEDPLMLWLRVSLKSHCISVFAMDESESLVDAIRGCLPSHFQKAA